MRSHHAFQGALRHCLPAALTALLAGTNLPTTYPLGPTP